ncbi:MAG: DUF2461 domain-containing protein [Balneola sp.]|jgi:uncharacterized protein (TIGR02453 family)|nr:DUF2461 domain-containing protein [Balneola sp.]
MIDQSYISFFEELEKNNHKEWFDEHRKDYENHVRKPFIELIEALIPALLEIESDLHTDAKKTLFRINRDIRFSKDKTPYNTLMKASLSSEGKKSEVPGFYVGIGAEHVHVGGGLYQLSKDRLTKSRDLIASHKKEFISIINDPEFKSNFGELQGERNKRLDKKYADLEDELPYIANKQFYAMAKFNTSSFVKDNNQVEALMKYFRAIQPLHAFLNRAF